MTARGPIGCFMSLAVDTQRDQRSGELPVSSAVVLGTGRPRLDST
jgi:hypothetical protein